jgi:hypothetical protein
MTSGHPAVMTHVGLTDTQTRRGWDVARGHNHPGEVVHAKGNAPMAK